MRFETFSTSRYQLDIEFEEQVGRMRLRDVYSGVEFADSDYRYSAVVECAGRVTRFEGLYGPELGEEFPERGGRIVTISGVLGPKGAEPLIRVHHRLYIPEDEDFLEEQIIIKNAGEREIALRDYRFGFRKLLEKPRAYGGPGTDVESYRLIAVPFRLQPDGEKHDYLLDDLYHARYQCSAQRVPCAECGQVVDANRGRSEAWAWTDGEHGVLIAKYNRKMIEFSMLETEERDGRCYLTYGGAQPCLYSEPREAAILPAGQELGFGHTRYQFYEGLWRRGAHLFREYMRSLGHGLPDDYNPTLDWNVACGVGPGDYCDEAILKTEAEKAVDMGCEGLHLDSVWEISGGSTVWDSERLGEAQDFVRAIKVDYGLEVGCRVTAINCGDDYPGSYRRTQDGRIGYHDAYNSMPLYEPCVCSEKYREEKLKRLLTLADAGISFITFDEFEWRGPCFDSSHGHPVPTTPDMHSRAVIELVQKAHERRPGMSIEVHDPIWSRSVRYLPVYYLHHLQGSFNETWAFEFNKNPLEDLISGRALSLFYYNLAYDLPLYLHINAADDNDRCLAFWWYASTVRHLGIGGGGDEKRLHAYKEAIATYKSLKDLYTQGEFQALDELTHIHVLPEAGRCALNAFNLTDTPISREVEVRLNDLGLLEELCVEGAPHNLVGGKLVLRLEIPPYSPLIVKMLPKEQGSRD